MIKNTPHINICICTFRRPKLLKDLIEKLQKQATENLFTYSIIVVDNDDKRSAEDVVSKYRNLFVPINYFHEPKKNIALARNRCVSEAKGDYIAFIDDDEFPIADWLLRLFKTCNQFKVDGVLGPVKPYFEKKPPAWLLKSKLCERPSYSTGKLLNWSETRTGNVLFKRQILNGLDYIFDPTLGIQGEDQDFFKRLIKKGCRFIWCQEAIVYDVVTSERYFKKYYIRRALLQGCASAQHFKREKKVKAIRILMKSFVASVAYSFALPVIFFCSHHLFMKYLVKDLHHISRLLGFFNIVKIEKISFR